MPSSTEARLAPLSPGQRRFMVAVSLALLAWLVYLNSLTNPFVFDDHRLILENRSFANLTSLRAILRRDITRPLVNVSYAVDLAAWGPGPFGLHVTSVLAPGRQRGRRTRPWSRCSTAVRTIRGGI